MLLLFVVDDDEDDDVRDKKRRFSTYFGRHSTSEEIKYLHVRTTGVFVNERLLIVCFTAAVIIIIIIIGFVVCKWCFVALHVFWPWTDWLNVIVSIICLCCRISSVVVISSTHLYQKCLFVFSSVVVISSTHLYQKCLFGFL